MWLRGLAWVLCFGLSACAVQTARILVNAPTELPAQIEWVQVPFFPQTPYQCGPAALATVLNFSGFVVQPETLTSQVFLPTRRGSLQLEMLASVPNYGALAVRIEPTLLALMRELSVGHPVVVLQNLGLSWAPRWHYAVVVGYNLREQTVILRSGTQRRQVLSLRTFEHTWARSNFWGFVVLLPGQWPVIIQEEGAVQAAISFEKSASAVLAHQVYASGLKRWPGSLTLSMGLANTAHALGDWAQAAYQFETAARRHRSAAAWINLSQVLLESGQVQAAIDAAQAAVDLADTAWQSLAQQALSQAQAHPAKLPAPQ
jgi:tetratricopeptide (TPR) repeat protein